MELKNTVEILYYALMQRWENSAPKDRRQGLLDGDPAINSQIERLNNILNKIALGNEEKTFNGLAACYRRNDGNSYVSKDSSWMDDPKPLCNGWFVEGTISLEQKKNIVQCLTRVGISPALVACIDDFVEGKSITQFAPNGAEMQRMLAKMRERNEIDDNEYTELTRDLSEK